MTVVNCEQLLTDRFTFGRSLSDEPSHLRSNRTSKSDRLLVHVQRTRLFLLSLSHFCVDFYATLLTPILPLIIERLELQLALAGFLGTILSLCNLTQPLMGVWGDRMNRRNLVLGGALLAAIFVPLLGRAPNYLTLAAFLAFGGLGVSAFHPQAFSLAGDLSPKSPCFRDLTLRLWWNPWNWIFPPLDPLFRGAIWHPGSPSAEPTWDVCRSHRSPLCAAQESSCSTYWISFPGSISPPNREASPAHYNRGRSA